ncbi:heme-binding protein [Vallitaleaceae bacterium 9-2]
MNEITDNYNRLLEEEMSLQLKKFSRSDAFELALIILEKVEEYEKPIIIEIEMNKVVIFRYFMDETIEDGALWLARKRNSVNLMNMSSLRFQYWLKQKNATISSRLLNTRDYIDCGGGYPIRIEGMGVMGSICVTGLIDTEDHKLIVDSLKAFKEKR